jgi:hypothetical protein
VKTRGCCACEDERRREGADFLVAFLLIFCRLKTRGCRFLDTIFLGGCLAGFLPIEVSVCADCDEGGIGVPTFKNQQGGNGVKTRGRVP